MVKKSWTSKLKDWRRRHEEDYARVLMSPPEHTTLLRAIPRAGVVLVMGGKGSGKSALAHDAAEGLHFTKNMPAVLHLPTIPKPMQQSIQTLLPPWMKVVTSTDAWPKGGIVLYDEASQGAHARRSQTDDAVELDNLMGISRQRNQVIFFISHHSRKLDVNVVRDCDRIMWKRPTWAHWLFERNELTDFVLKALDYFNPMKDGQALKSCLMMDFHHLLFQEFTNGLPSYWSERLSHLFEDIKKTNKKEAKKDAKRDLPKKAIHSRTSG